MICAQQIYLDDQIEDEEKRELVIITGGEKCTKYHAGESERKSRLGRLTHGWENVIIMDLKDMEWKDMD